MLFLCCLILCGAKLTEDNNDFFNIDETVAMRGFWCIVVVLVHVPELYQNRIQDMIGSFAYVGVTFYFMASAFGLKYGIINKPDSINVFWKRRLPKILIPIFIVSIVTIVAELYCGNEIHLIYTFNFCQWVKWLLICYLFFWIVYRNDRIKHKDAFISALIIVFSMLMYFIRDYYWTTTWTTEIFGFIWGLLLAENYVAFKNKALEKWWIKSFALCVLSIVFGIFYLRVKSFYFFGEYLLKIILGFSILLFILHLTCRIRISNQLANFIGKISYEIFLCHGAVMSLLDKLFPGMYSGLFIILSIASTIVLSIIINYISKKALKGIFGY